MVERGVTDDILKSRRTASSDRLNHSAVVSKGKLYLTFFFLRLNHLIFATFWVVHQPQPIPVSVIIRMDQHDL